MRPNGKIGRQGGRDNKSSSGYLRAVAALKKVRDNQAKDGGEAQDCGGEEGEGREA